jgi:FkbM family methyltransferase
MLTYAQNFEDVMLARLFRGHAEGFYVDVGAWDPVVHSVTKHFYDIGWSGINIEPIAKQYQLFVDARPNDDNLNVAVGDHDGRLRFHECVDLTSLSTADDDQAAALRKAGHLLKTYEVEAITLADIAARCQGKTVDFLKIDAEGFEKRILGATKWTSFRPRVLVIEAIRPAVAHLDWDNPEALRNWDSWEPLVLDAGYLFAWYDGLNRFYIRREDAELARRLVLPPGVYDELQFPEIEAAKKAIEAAEAARMAKELELTTVNADRSIKEQALARLTFENIALAQRSAVAGLAGKAESSSVDGETRSTTVRSVSRSKFNTRLIRAIRAMVGVRLGQFEIYPPRGMYVKSRYHRPQGASGTLRVSIVTPVFNQSRFIAAAIESVLDQNYPALEYIVMDGKSTDGTWEIIERYRPRLARLESGKDGGQANAINKGISYATGDVLAWLNGDDLLLPGAVEYVAHYFETHPQIDVVYGHRVLIDAEDFEIGRWVLPDHDDEILSWVDYVPQETLFWRRRAWELVGSQLDESFQFAMDWDLLLRFRDAGASFARLPRFLGAFRVHMDQKSTKEIGTKGFPEMDRLRKRCLGYKPSPVEIRRKMMPYLLKHLVVHNMERVLGRS